LRILEYIQEEKKIDAIRKAIAKEVKA